MRGRDPKWGFLRDSPEDIPILSFVLGCPTHPSHGRVNYLRKRWHSLAFQRIWRATKVSQEQTSRHHMGGKFQFRFYRDDRNRANNEWSVLRTGLAMLNIQSLTSIHVQCDLYFKEIISIIKDTILAILHHTNINKNKNKIKQKTYCAKI